MAARLADRLERCSCGQARPAGKQKACPPPLQALGFTLEELREARLAPIVSFKGRGVSKAGERRLSSAVGRRSFWL